MSKHLNSLYKKLRRTTASNAFIPEIDGLRFLAIFLVVFLHLSQFVIDKTPFPLLDSPNDYWPLANFLNNGGRGVYLFFAISGFILALPFARHYLANQKKIRLKDFYRKRLTRLEPPYIIVTLLCFFLLILKGKYGLTELLAPLGSSLLYLHNIFPLGPYINGVAWSLEVEVQFYILVPLFTLLFKLRPLIRRSAFIFIILLFPILNYYLQSPYKSLYSYLHFFFIGFLLADLFVSEFKIRLNKISSLAIGLPAFLALIYIDLSSSLLNQLVFPMLIFVFYYLALNDQIWKRVWSQKVFTTLGGMCYTIYLIHVPIMSGIGNISAHWQFSQHYIPTLLIQGLIIIPIMILSSFAFFLLVEKPCMDKDWPRKLWERIRAKKEKTQVIFKGN